MDPHTTSARMEQTMREQERGSTAARNRDEATQRGSAAARLVSMALLSTRSQQILFADACCLLLLCAPRFAIEGRLSGESSREWVRRPVSRRRALPRRCRRRPWRRRHRLERDPRPTDRQTDRHTHTSTDTQTQSAAVMRRSRTPRVAATARRRRTRRCRTCRRRRCLLRAAANTAARERENFCVEEARGARRACARAHRLQPRGTRRPCRSSS